MNPIIYKSTDTSAPILTGQVGKLTALLDACLVTGYGSQSALGWAKPFTSTNAVVYRAATGLRHYLQVNDAPGDARYAAVVAYETMTAYNTGTNLFPTAVQMAAGTFWNKSATADATARAWTLVGDDKTFYLVIVVSTGTAISPTGFGEFETYKAGDVYNTFIAGGATLSVTAACGLVGPGTYGSAGGGSALYVARSYSQAGSAINPYVVGPVNSGAVLGSSGFTYPNAVDGGLYVGPVFLCEIGTGTPIRGRLRGLYAPLHAAPLSMYDTATNIAGLPGATGVAVPVASNNASGQVLFDVTGPW